MNKYDLQDRLQKAKAIMDRYRYLSVRRVADFAGIDYGRLRRLLYEWSARPQLHEVERVEQAVSMLEYVAQRSAEYMEQARLVVRRAYPNGYTRRSKRFFARLAVRLRLPDAKAARRQVFARTTLSAAEAEELYVAVCNLLDGGEHGGDG